MFTSTAAGARSEMRLEGFGDANRAEKIRLDFPLDAAVVDGAAGGKFGRN
jgi:hypothetical protein